MHNRNYLRRGEQNPIDSKVKLCYKFISEIRNNAHTALQAVLFLSQACKGGDARRINTSSNSQPPSYPFVVDRLSTKVILCRRDLLLIFLTDEATTSVRST